MQARDTAFYAVDSAQWEKYHGPDVHDGPAGRVVHDESRTTRESADPGSEALCPGALANSIQRGDIVLARFFSGGLWVLEVRTRETGTWMVLMSQVTTAKP